ncbi:MAG: D-alanyl-D-alanine carboxypeptidase [Lachnospiraceae bacterium]|nr:D-alanyl-D-alanine carboxypeptidase [Lachnospiraceae bacterium]
MILLSLTIILENTLPVLAAPEISAPSAVLVEASTGQVVFEQNGTAKRSPASITKIMTLLLIFDALEKGKIKLEDTVSTSAHAKSMGGSQVFLEEGEIQTVDTLIKCIAVASGNDASVAMAEYIAGSEAAFVEQMNTRAQSLHMENTYFTDCCGLTDSDEHYTTAEDEAIMSRELITRYPQIYQYTKIWMEDIVHETRQGSKNFTLSSTNKLLKQYQWTTGLKTGSTSKAKFCVSATARKDDMDLIAVIMGAPDPKVRFKEAATLLNFGFSTCSLYTDPNEKTLAAVVVERGKRDTVQVVYKGSFQILDTEGNTFQNVVKDIHMEPAVAPVEQGEKAGEAVYSMNGRRLGSVDILYAEDVPEAEFIDYLIKTLKSLLL